MTIEQKASPPPSPPAKDLPPGDAVDSAQALFDSLKSIFERSKEEVVRGARVSRARLDVYQLRRDRDRALQRLGEEAYALLQTETLKSQDLASAFAVVKDIDARIQTLEDEMKTPGSEAKPADGLARGEEGTAPQPSSPGLLSREVEEEELSPGTTSSVGPASLVSKASPPRSSGEAANRGRGRASEEKVSRVPARGRRPRG